VIPDAALRRARGGSVVRVSVADTGDGIPVDRLREIFEPFVQVHSALTQGRDGLGLGLAIARSIVVMHGGEITAESGGSGKGAAFTVVLPTIGRQSIAAVSAGADADIGSALR
jgi:signal transduction histidine kinase